MNELVVRGAAPGDFQDILEILNYEILNGTAIFDHNPKVLADIEKYYFNRLENNFPFLVVTKEQKVVGYATYGTFRTKEGYKCTVEHSIYIHHSFLNQGIGRLLMDQLICHAKNHRIKSLIAGIAKENKGSIEFHKKLGFKEVGSIPFAATKFDRWLELVFLQLVVL